MKKRVGDLKRDFSRISIESLRKVKEKGAARERNLKKFDKNLIKFEKPAN